MYFPATFIKDGHAEALTQALIEISGDVAVRDTHDPTVIVWDGDYVPMDEVCRASAPHLTAGIVLIFEDRDAYGARQFTGVRLEADGTWTTLVTQISFADPVTDAVVTVWR